jgi:hypothetical protein
MAEIILQILGAIAGLALALFVAVAVDIYIINDGKGMSSPEDF